jgi:hypothetical protein
VGVAIRVERNRRVFPGLVFVLASPIDGFDAPSVAGIDREL